MYALLQSFIALFLSIFTIFSSAYVMPMKGDRVDEAKLSARYQNSSWSGEFISANGHTAEVEGGLLYVDGIESVYPADSSVDGWVEPALTDSRGTWFVDYEANKIRHDSRGKNLFTFDLADAKTLKDPHEWTATVDGDLIYVYNYDKSLITIIDTPRYGILASTYGSIPQ